MKYYSYDDAKKCRQELLAGLAPLSVMPGDIDLASAVLSRHILTLPRTTLMEAEFARAFTGEHGEGLLNLMKSPCPRVEELIAWAKTHLVPFSRGCL